MKYITSYIRRTDRVLWLLCFALSALGIVLLMGILDSGYTHYLGISNRNLAVQGMSVVIGTIAAIVVSLFDYKDLIKLWRVHGAICYALIILTFFVGVGAIGRPEDRRWLVIPGTNLFLQPSELLRISFILIFAYHIYLVYERLNHPLSVGGLLLHGALPVVLMHLQGDDGSALIFAAIVVCMLFGAGIAWKYIFAAIIAAAAAIPFMWYFVLSPFQRQRFLVLIDPASADVQGFFFQQHRALIAFAMGDAGGTGIFYGSHVYVPEMHNDFIFSFLGESLGFVGSLLSILVMAALWLKILACVGRARDLPGRLICTGVFGLLSFQAIINIGMNISLLPVIGNTLPFISYGGSSMLGSYLAIGIVLSVYMHSDKSMFGS